MELRQLKYLLEIVNYSGFTKASEALGIAQSALSVTVKNLEEEIGITLIDRNYRKFTLTAEGKIFTKKAAEIIDQVSTLQHEMEELKGLVRGTLRVGIPGMLATHFFSEKISEFRGKYPNLKMSILSDGAKKLEKMLCDGQLDVAILGEEDLSSGLIWKPLLKDEMVACVASSHHLASKKEITIQELAQETLFLFKKGNYQRAILTEAFEEINQEVNVAFETNLTSLLKSMTAKGDGICTLLRMAVDSSDLVPISLKPRIEISAGVAWRSKSYLSLASKAFIDFLIEENPDVGAVRLPLD